MKDYLPGYLTIMSSRAGVISERVDMQMAPDSEMNRSRSGTSKAIATERKK
jgi:hypothetical protein